MTSERNYAFRQRLDQVHRPDRRDPDSKPNPGWWPCTDYPDWLNLVKRVIRRHNPDADVVFWTYNWGWAPEKDRVALVRTLPDDVSLQVTFEMFEDIERRGAPPRADEASCITGTDPMVDGGYSAK